MQESTKQCLTCGSGVAVEAAFCPHCGSSLSGEQTPVVEKGRSRFGWVFRAGIVLVFVVGVLSFYRDAFRTYHPVIEKQPDVLQAKSYGNEKIPSSPVQARIEGPFLIISLKEVAEKRIVRFYDPTNQQPVPILAYITPSGRLVTAMSLSENCRSTDFYLEGENIHCANCPSYWNASSLEAYACCQKFYPDPIPSTVLGDEVRIELSKVRSWQARS
ncbi:MAG: Fe-S-containing protein [Bacteroidota bacterium]